MKRHNLDIPIVGGACSFGLERKSASAKLFAPWFGIYYCPFHSFGERTEQVRVGFFPVRAAFPG